MKKWMSRAERWKKYWEANRTNPEFKARYKKWRDANADTVRSYRRDYYERNKERLAAHAKEYNHKYRFRQSLKQSKAKAKRDGYKACSATEQQIQEAFNGSCHCCGALEQNMNRKLAMDHNHETGEFRGWLCNRCNRALGLLDDKEQGVVNLLSYIRRRRPPPR